MSEFNEDQKEIKVEDQSSTENLTEGLRSDSTSAPINRFLKNPVIHVEDSERPLTAADVKKMAEQIQNNLRKEIQEARLDEFAGTQVVLKENVKLISDFSKVSMDDIYDLNIPIEAKPFMSADLLYIKLKDTNYEARWVNINPQNLGDKIAKGFSYIVPEDLADTDEPIKAAKDAEGHYRFNDVVAMKIDKATYYKALRAAFLRAVNTTNAVKAREKAAETANEFMRKQMGNDFITAASQRKMQFYNPDVGI